MSDTGLQYLKAEGNCPKLAGQIVVIMLRFIVGSVLCHDSPILKFLSVYHLAEAVDC